MLTPPCMPGRTCISGAPPWRILRPILGRLVPGGPKLARPQVCTRMVHISAHAHLVHAHAHTLAPSPKIPAHVLVQARPPCAYAYANVRSCVQLPLLDSPIFLPMPDCLPVLYISKCIGFGLEK